MSFNKLQELLITHLQKHGSVKLLLPDNVVLEIGVNQESADGKLVNVDDYCWIMASREGRSAILDKFNLGIRFDNEEKAVVLEDEFVTREGDKVRRLDVV
jgi:hypothetical protein